MSDDLARATALLAGGDHTCVLCRGQETLTSDAGGVAALVDWHVQGRDLTGFSAADKVVGRAAALLYAAAGVRAVHAVLAGAAAEAVCRAHGIAFTAETTVPVVLNRARTTACPMEAAVAGIDDPNAAATALVAEVRRLRGH